MTASPWRVSGAAAAHAAAIADQFTRQAVAFAASPVHHDKAALDLLVEMARPQLAEVSLDVACGPGSVVAAFARHVSHATGLDATEAMLKEARMLAARQGLNNIAWHRGDAYALPFLDGTFDIVSCRFAFHHLQEPARAFAEMVRVTRPGGRVVLCDAVASDDPAKAAAFNAMERHRDPSTVAFRPLAFLRGLYAVAGLAEPAVRFYGVPAERERLVAMSHPVSGDRAGLRAMLDAAVHGDAMGVGARREGDTVRFEYPAAVLVAVKGRT
ncbi:MAG TPA: class I SAM-dependent methyltransferase [Hyphomicrobiaceae bacterium]|jgi:ubiquinone/menaquinone biosynthesis C-methylase UbiE|nr:class I SAM-dependent methyltransferase [Hyphomicrobiaceae bacterium]